MEAAIGERGSGDDGYGDGGNDRVYGILDDDGYVDFSNDNDHDHDQKDVLSYGKGRGEKN